MAQQAAKKGVNRKAMKKLLAFARHHNVNVSSLDTTLTKMANDLADTAAWDTHGFGRLVFDEQGRRLTGFDALERRLKQLRTKAAHTAAEVDLDAMIARADGATVDNVVVDVPTTDALEGLIDDEVAGWTRAVAARLDEPTTRQMEAALAAADSADEHVKILADYAKRSGGMPSVPKAGDVLDEADLSGDPWAISGGLAEMSLALDMIRFARGEAVPNWDLAAIEGVARKSFQPGPLRDEMMYQAAARQGVTSLPGPPNPAAAKLRDLKAGMDKRGYKLVHGVEFLMPEDLAFNVPTFHDVTRRHMNAATMGNWFGRRHPVEVQVLDDRRRRLAIVKQLNKVGKDLGPEDDEVTNILETLERWLRAEQDDVAKRMNEAHMEPIVTKTADRIRSSFTPVRLDDVGGFRKSRDKVLKALDAIGLSEDETLAVWRATNDFRNTDFKDMGLYAVESYLRTKSAPAGFLKALGGSKYGGNVTGRVARQAVTGAAIGGVAGAAAAGGDASFEERLKATLMGGGLGAVAGGALAGGVNAWDKSKDIIQTAEDWRYGYLADGYARLRDAMRFTLSPFFDLSRYTEGLMLAQTAAPLRSANGERVVVPFNMSPWRLRHRAAKKLMEPIEKGGQGMSEQAAKVAARNQYDRHLAEFNAASRAAKDFDIDAIDSAGQWFRQVGVLGFSPTDWMATAFTHLRTTGGLSVEDAYREARGMYQYGTRGRSAAELSVNFVLFPFSFQKKALTHIGKWMNDDLGRSIMIHDALKSYELLDERYNLDEYWKEHIPFLQQLGRLNLFAYGISPGRLGGINSQLFEGAGKVALNAFIPGGFNIRDAAAGKELQDIGKQLLPVFNDINWMMRDLREVAYPVAVGAFTPMAAQSYDAQVRDGYDEWNAYKRDFETMLADQGLTMADVRNEDYGLDELNAQYEQKLLEIQQKYPAWWDSRMETPGNVQAMEMEKNNRIDRVTFGPSIGITPSVDDMHTAEMQQFIDLMMEEIELMTGSTKLEDAPAGVWDEVKRKAVELADINPGFVALWNKFWRWEWGDIEIRMELNDE
jgi:hypothetical protein